MRRGDPVAWEPFVVASLLLAISAGFGLGGLLMAAAARHAVSGRWWEVAAQAHGHMQLFGWAGLMVLGVGLHVLPRLRGAPLAHAAGVRPACALLVAGLALRAVGQPALAVDRPGAIHTLLGAALVGSGLLELGGVGLVLWMLGCTACSGPPMGTRPGLRAVLPFFIVAFGALFLALAVNVGGLVAAVRGGQGLVPEALDDLTAGIAFYAFLLPVSLAMSARTIPIFLRTALPRLTLLRAALALLLGGLALRAAGDLAGIPLAGGVGRLTLTTALVLGIVALGVFGRRRPLPRDPAPLTDPVQVQMLSAYLWLLVVIALLILGGLDKFGVIGIAVDPDAERHALGAGFVTLLILGVGAFLLPGMTGRRRLSWGLFWTTGACANVAALLRVAPVAVPGLLPGASAAATTAASGLFGLVALALFGLNVVIGQSPAPAVARRGA